jgi:PhoH-like ATPase
VIGKFSKALQLTTKGESMRPIIIDTNLLMDDPKILYKLLKDYDKLRIPISVLNKLDELKLNADTSYSARNAIYAILEFKEKHPDEIEFLIDEDDINKSDRRIVKNSIDTGSDLATKNISTSLIAESEGVHTLLYDVIVNNIFDPYVVVSSNELFDMSPNFCFKQNYQDEDYYELLLDIKGINADAWMFLFVKNEEKIEALYANNPMSHKFERIDNIPTYRSIGGDKMVLKALDAYQICAFYAFENAPNVLLTGKWGSGKTLLSTAYAISNSRRKIFITRPPIGINKKYDLGFLPGNKEDKMIDWFAGFFSALYYLYANTRGQDGGKGIEYDYVKDKIFKEKFETIPLNAIQGLSLLESDTMIVDETQLIDIDYLSMIISRSGSGSRLILLGDLAQTYGVVKPSESGLLKLLRLLPHSCLAYIRLEKSYRSGLIDLADKLQDRVIN